ncbi:penicillin-binding transpeptidase domain-containing protein [Entomospira entomophila]|uniref:PASTA domain-containing protein n=1 Tax=Entomospira entomophila TaxID=2719988 RepID=A0A968GB51_9SPIO|nr:penicillin-binding transpeptidase domain-containing protein [Entomospira entomophilus]NIZ40151.1 hypothetical protein [Entomospira entomophilus]WDI35709.1 penicillin-binding transpeptidase domain-containing protein [Entomospira entomophilus]
MFMHRKQVSSQLKSLKSQSHLTSRQKIITILTAIALSLIILFSMWIMRKGKVRPTGSSITNIARGSIYDRNGRVLATQVENYTVSLWLPSLRNSRQGETEQEREERIDEISNLLGPIVLWPQRELYDKILYHTSNTLILLRRADVQIKERLQAVIQTTPIPGLQIEAEFSRSYPQGDLAAPLIGYLNLDSRGGEGIEYAFDRFLAPVTVAEDSAPQHSYSLELTLDINLQASTEAIISQAIRNEEAEAGVALIMDAKSGEILTYVSLPSFNPSFYQRYTADERINRPIVEAYEPGSVFKVFTLAAMIDARVIDPGETFCCPGHYEQTINGQTFRIKCTAEHGDQTVADVLANSCNAGMAYFSERMSNDEFHDAIGAFGFGKKTNIPLSGETVGLLKDTKDWSARTKPTLAMGQEIGVSSMQIMQAATAFTNQGIMIKPRIVKHLLHEDGSIYQSYQREEVGRAFSPRTATILLSQLQHSVETGIARRLQIPDLAVGGKTGTSQTIDQTTRSYSDEKYIASTLAFVPADDPQYIVYIVIHHPIRSIWGSNVAAPLARDIINLLVSHVGLPTSRTKVIQLKRTPTIPQPEYLTTSPTLPNFEGESLRQALHFFTEDHLYYRIDGTGFWVSEQFPPAGSLIRPDMTIRFRSTPTPIKVK